MKGRNPISAPSFRGLLEQEPNRKTTVESRIEDVSHLVPRVLVACPRRTRRLLRVGRRREQRIVVVAVQQVLIDQPQSRAGQDTPIRADAVDGVEYVAYLFLVEQVERVELEAQAFPARQSELVRDQEGGLGARGGSVAR